MIFRLCLFVAISGFWTFGSSSSQVVVRPADSIPVHDVFFKQTRAIDILKRVSERYSVVMGLTGKYVGSDRLLLDVSLNNGSLSDLMNLIVADDPRLSWKQNSDGAIQVTLGSSLTGLFSTIIGTYDVEGATRSEAMDALTRSPEVGIWLGQHHCELGSLTIHPTGQDGATLSIHLRTITLGAALDELARESKTYFWSAIEYRDDPCTININP